MSLWNTVLFDFDGTICNTAEGVTRAMAYALGQMGIEPPPLEELRVFIGPPLEPALCEFYQMTPEQANACVQQFRVYYNDRGVWECTPYPGIELLLHRLRQAGYTIALATSKPWVFAEQILDRFGLRDCFDVVSGAELSGEHTDKEDVIRRALAQCPAGSTAVMVGDRKFDAYGAAAVGIPCIGVAYGFGSPQELEEAGVAQVVADIPALERLLLAHT